MYAHEMSRLIFYEKKKKKKKIRMASATNFVWHLMGSTNAKKSLSSLVYLRKFYQWHYRTERALPRLILRLQNIPKGLYRDELSPDNLVSKNIIATQYSILLK